MKRVLLFLAAIPVLTGCSPVNNGGEIEKKDDSVIAQYIDDGKVISVEDFEFRLDLDPRGTSKNIFIPFYVTSKKLEKTELKLQNGYIYRESNGAKYEAFTLETLQLENEVEKYRLYNVQLPSSLTEEKYQFVFTALNKTITYYLYNNPANYFTVSYKAENKIVHTETVYKGEYYKGYTYGYADHFQYVKNWVGEGKTVTAKTPITEDVTLVPIPEEAVKYATTNLDTFSWISSINYIFDDGVCILREQYQEKPIGILNSLAKNVGFYDLYLPATFAHAGYRVFKTVENLTIHYPGTEDAWNSKIAYTDGFGTGTKLVFNSSYGYDYRYTENREYYDGSTEERAFWIDLNVQTNLLANWNDTHSSYTGYCKFENKPSYTSNNFYIISEVDVILYSIKICNLDGSTSIVNPSPEIVDSKYRRSITIPTNAYILMFYRNYYYVGTITIVKA